MDSVLAAGTPQEARRHSPRFTIILFIGAERSCCLVVGGMGAS